MRLRSKYEALMLIKCQGILDGVKIGDHVVIRENKRFYFLGDVTHLTKHRFTVEYDRDGVWTKAIHERIGGYRRPFQPTEAVAYQCLAEPELQARYDSLKPYRAWVFSRVRTAYMHGSRTERSLIGDLNELRRRYGVEAPSGYDGVVQDHLVREAEWLCDEWYAASRANDIPRAMMMERALQDGTPSNDLV